MNESPPADWHLLFLAYKRGRTRAVFLKLASRHLRGKDWALIIFMWLARTAGSPHVINLPLPTFLCHESILPAVLL